ncbi:MAG: oxidoreductase [Actinomycetota bacterium]|nr:MAG: oxidoreductase [Actinomycetota bacterium]
MSKPVRSLQIRHVDAGSCNGCEQELTALTGRDYDMQRYGLDIVASPRHADAMLVTGPVTDTMARSVERVWQAISVPKIRIAFGDCAAGCGFSQDSYASHGGLNDPDLTIAGCPPEPGKALSLLRAWMASHDTHGMTSVEVESNSKKIG